MSIKHRGHAPAWSPEGSYNPGMHTLRRFRWFACFMLASWALSLAAAAVSPLGGPPTIERICSGSGPEQFMVAGDLSPVPPGGHTLDCPLCLPAVAPAPTSVAAWCGALPPTQGLCALQATPRATSTAAPLQARGPPIAL